MITHCHSDHINGIKFVSELPIYSPCPIKSITGEIAVIPYEPFSIGDIKITPLKLSHDAPETVGYIFKADEELVYITDTGYVSDRLRALLRNADAYLIESNHDLELLRMGRYPWSLKQRILGDHGHLSNDDGALAISEMIGDQTKRIFLGHLSQDNNIKALAHETAESILLSKGHGVNDAFRVLDTDPVTPTELFTV